MAFDLVISLTAGFLFVALVGGWVASRTISAAAPERRRLRQLATAGPSDLLNDGNLTLVDNIDPRFKRIPGVPKSPSELGRLRRRLARAGFTSPNAVFAYSVATLVMPIVLALTAISIFGVAGGWLYALCGAGLGYLVPSLVIGRMTERRKREIRDGLPDALDLLIVCVESGSGLDQAIVRASDELDITYPSLAYELRLITTEIRAGKPRLEAFKNFAARTQVDDVRSLVALLVQTDKFGTSIAQALRTHAEISRTKRRQDAEERANKLGVKLAFPLVLFLFPAIWIVTLGPAVIAFVRVFMNIANK